MVLLGCVWSIKEGKMKRLIGSVLFGLLIFIGLSLLCVRAPAQACPPDGCKLGDWPSSCRACHMWF